MIFQGYLDTFKGYCKRQYLYSKIKINSDDIKLVTSDVDIDGLRVFLINDIEMSDKRVQNSLKKFHNNYKNEVMTHVQYVYHIQMKKKVMFIKLNADISSYRLYNEMVQIFKRSVSVLFR